MRILMLSHGYPPTLSGVTRVVQKISRGMVKRGHQVCVVAASDRGSAYQSNDEGVELVRLRSFFNPFWHEGRVPWISIGQLRQIIHRTNPDLIHSHENLILSSQLLKISPSLAIPVIVSCYFLPEFASHYLRVGEVPGKYIQAYQWKWIIESFNQYDHAVFSTQAHLRPYQEHQIKVPTSVISNGVDFDRYNSVHSKALDSSIAIDLPPGPRILFVSRLARDKKIDVLLRAMPAILKRKQASLLLVGRGDDRPRLEELARSLHIEKSIHFLGHVPEQVLPDLYKACHVFTLVSDCEVQSIPTLQALAAGIPVVAANAAALPEIVFDGVNGCLVPPNDPAAVSRAVLELLENPEKASQLGCAGIEIARKHADSSVLEQFETLYQTYHRIRR
jgi:glycosyltransferase involved in cell wall biosynthesis